MRIFYTFLLLCLFGRFATYGQDQPIKIKHAKPQSHKIGWEATNETLMTLDPTKAHELSITGCKNFSIKGNTPSGSWFQTSGSEDKPIELTQPPKDLLAESEDQSFKLECTCNDDPANKADIFSYPIYKTTGTKVTANITVEFKFDDPAWTTDNQLLLDSLNPKGKQNEIKIEGCKTYDVTIMDKNEKVIMKKQGSAGQSLMLDPIASDKEFNEGWPFKLELSCKDETPETKKEFSIFGKKKQPSEEYTCCVNYVSTKSNKTECLVNYDNKFGEDNYLARYDDHRITYIYDFNHGKPFNVLYKVRREKDKLKIEPVNPNTEKIDSKDYGQIKIVNVNRFTYDVSISDSIVSSTSEPSSLFNQLFLGDSNILGGLLESMKSTLSGQIVAVNENKKNKGSNGNECPPPTTLLGKLECFSKKYNGLHAQILQAYNPCSEFPCCQNEDYHNLANDLVDIKIGLARLITEESGKIKKDLEEKKKALAECKATLQTIATKTQRINDIKKLSKAEQKLDKIKEELVVLKLDIAKLTAEKCDEKVKTLEAEIKQMDDQLKANAAVETLKAGLPSEENLKKMVVFINNMVQQHDSYAIDIPQLNGDQLEITFNIQSRDSITRNYNLVGYHHSPKPIAFPIAHKSFKPVVSFSSGSFVNMGNGLQNKVYVWQPVPSSSGVVDIENSNYKLTESGTSMPVMGFAALANLLFNNKGNFSFGASVGVGITIENNPRYAYLTGLTIATGKLRQLALTLGIAVMPIEKLNSNLTAVYEQGILYSAKEDIRYYKKLQAGAMVAITYTPFKTKKK